MYTIIDIETTGNGIKGNKITEISIFKYDGHEVVDEYTSLVNPECEISTFITSLTGIDNNMVRNAPVLEDIIPEIEAITKDTIFVAHSVNFDYNVIKNEFKQLGREFSRKKLCTVRLSRKLLPGYNSYSLGKLTAALGIPEETGNELIALLKESAEIKHHYPKYNSAQKRSIQQYGIFSYEDRNGIIHLAFNKIKMTPNALAICYSPTEARQYLEALCNTFELCPKYCHLQENVTSCSHYKIKQCIGICSNTDLVYTYNERVQEALQSLKDIQSDLVIKTNGRNSEENAFVIIQENSYAGYGFVPKETPIEHIEDLETYIIPQKNTLETQRIVESYIRKNPNAIFSL